MVVVSTHPTSIFHMSRYQNFLMSGNISLSLLATQNVRIFPDRIGLNRRTAGEVPQLGVRGLPLFRRLGGAWLLNDIEGQRELQRDNSRHL